MEMVARAGGLGGLSLSRRERRGEARTKDGEKRSALGVVGPSWVESPPSSLARVPLQKKKKKKPFLPLYTHLSNKSTRPLSRAYSSSSKSIRPAHTT